MLRTLAVVLGFGLAIGASASCGPPVDLTKALKVTEVFTGWYDFGIVDGMNKLVPSISFRLQNVGTAPVNEVDLTVAFWQDGGTDEWDSKEVRAIESTSLQPGQSTEPILVRSSVGYTGEQPRAEMFTNTYFKDASARVFAKRSGAIVRLGEFKLDRRIIPHLLDQPGQQ